jgi:hypothetical protein
MSSPQRGDGGECERDQEEGFQKEKEEKETKPPYNPADRLLAVVLGLLFSIALALGLSYLLGLISPIESMLPT